MDDTNDFIMFTQELSRGQQIEGAAAGIASKAKEADSLFKLSDAQYKTFIVSVKSWLVDHFRGYRPPFLSHGEEPPMPACTECAQEVPWCEVYIAGLMNRGRCTWCMQVRHKDD